MMKLIEPKKLVLTNKTYVATEKVVKSALYSTRILDCNVIVKKRELTNAKQKSKYGGLCILKGKEERVE